MENIYKLIDNIEKFRCYIHSNRKTGISEIGESYADSVKNGPFLTLDSNNYSYESKFYFNDNEIGPRLSVRGGRVEFSYSNGVNKYVGYRIVYENGTIAIFLYDRKGNDYVFNQGFICDGNCRLYHPPVQCAGQSVGY